MVNFTKVCPYCGEEYWETHECEGTRRAIAEELARREAEMVAAELARQREAAVAAIQRDAPVVSVERTDGNYLLTISKDREGVGQCSTSEYINRLAKEYAKATAIEKFVISDLEERLGIDDVVKRPNTPLYNAYEQALNLVCSLRKEILNRTIDENKVYQD